MLADAIARYHDLLAVGDRAAVAHAELDRLQRDRGLLVGGRPVCSVLRPRFLTPVLYRRLCDRAAAVLPALRLIAERAVADPAFRRQLRLEPWEGDLLGIDPGYPDPGPVCRLDGYLDPVGGVRFTEFNADAPAGAGYADGLAQAFPAGTAFREFRRFYHVTSVPSRPGLVRALTAAYRQWAGVDHPPPPSVAILDWAEVPTAPEFALLAAYLRGLGVEARPADPRAVEYRGGRLWTGDFPVTLVYKRVLTRELVERGGADHPVVRAARDRAVCVVNSFRCRVLARKASFAAVTDERNAGLFAPGQVRAVADHVPWTRLLEDRWTVYRGEAVDLVPFVLRHRERFVLKPNDASGGRGVVLGAESDPGTWERAVTAGLYDVPAVVQERVPAAVEPFPVPDGGGCRVVDRVVDTGLFVAGGTEPHGCLTRVSAGPVVSVAAAGACAAPTFLIEAR